MANVDSPSGLVPVGHLLGLPWNSRLMKCYIPATDGTAVFVHDAVDLAGSSDASGTCPTVTQITVGANHPIFGVVVGFEPDPTNLSLVYRPASTARYCYVCCDPFVVYQIQGCSNAVLGVSTVGLNGVLIATHLGSTSTGKSGLELDSGAGAAPAANQTYQLLVLGASTDIKNDIATVNAKWHVIITLHRLLPNYTGAAYMGALGV